MTELDKLLVQIRDGDASPATMARARSLLAVDVRLPEELRQVFDDDDDPSGTAAALLGVLGLDDGLFGGLLQQALAEEGGWLAPASASPLAFQPEEHPITAQDLAEQEAEGLPPVADAVRASAGEVDLAVDVLRAMGVNVIDVAAAIRDAAGEVELAADVVARLGAVAVPVDQAVATLAGEVDVAASVVSPLGEVLWPVDAAVRALAGEIDVARAVLAAVGAPAEQAIADAVRDLAGDVDVVPAVMAHAGGTSLPLAEAVRSLAGTVDVAATLAEALAPSWVSALIDHELSPAAHRLAAHRLASDASARAQLTALADLGQALRKGVHEEAGSLASVWPAVAAHVGIAAEEVAGWDQVPLAEAVRDQAGTTDVRDAVLQRIQRNNLDTADTAAPDQAANAGGWLQWGGLALAAAALLVVAIGLNSPLDTAGRGGQDAVAVHMPDFASHSEITVEDLSYGEDTTAAVLPFQDDDGHEVLIIWVDEEA